ncbi:homoserine kinase type II [Kribbella amoyensis]|uniref:Homoserine kinase type II n=2 Tax=Kribbella amoyensis TaxID=996641 RepID=A0A561BZU5_9ACTN|nr:homoserine kinase type II [Kribbella amoyensis]
MLWESTDAPSALRDRFGFGDFDEAAQWLTKILAEVWAVNADGCERIVISDRNAIAWVSTDHGDLIAKWSCAREQFAKFDATADLIHAMHEQGLPVADPLASVDGRRRVVLGPLSVTLQPTIVGEPLDITDAAAVRTAGAWLAKLHGALARYEDAVLADTVRRPELDLRARVTQWLDHDPRKVPAASDRLRALVETLPPVDAGAQLIHSDYRSSNLLTAASDLVAVLDFDELAWDYGIGDLANSFVRLGTLFRNWAPTPAPVRETFLAGYESVRPLTDLERDWLDTLALWQGLAAIPPGDDPTGWAAAV